MFSWEMIFTKEVPRIRQKSSLKYDCGSETSPRVCQTLYTPSCIEEGIKHFGESDLSRLSLNLKGLFLLVLVLKPPNPRKGKRGSKREDRGAGQREAFSVLAHCGSQSGMAQCYQIKRVLKVINQ